MVVGEQRGDHCRLLMFFHLGGGRVKLILPEFGVSSGMIILSDGGLLFLIILAIRKRFFLMRMMHVPIQIKLEIFKHIPGGGVIPSRLLLFYRFGRMVASTRQLL